MPMYVYVPVAVPVSVLAPVFVIVRLGVFVRIRISVSPSGVWCLAPALVHVSVYVWHCKCQSPYL